MSMAQSRGLLASHSSRLAGSTIVRIRHHLMDYNILVPTSSETTKPGVKTGLVISNVRISLAVQEAAEFPGAARVLQLAERLGLDLADALAGDRELLADLFQRVVGVHADAEAHPQHALLARRQRRED